MVKRISPFNSGKVSMIMRSRRRLMSRLVIFMLSAVFLLSNAQAALTASVDRNPVSMNESFTLTLESNESIDGEPDFSPLQSDFDILNTQQSSRFQMINGSTSRTIQWQLTLLAKHSGIINIPAIKVEQQLSQPIALTVNKVANTSNAASDQDLYLKIETTPEHVYVQQQLLFTIKLFYALDSGLNLAQNSSLSEPELEIGDAVIKKLGQDKNFQTNNNGRRYQVIQRRYAVFPQQSGKITFKPINFEGRMIQQSRSRFGMYDPFQQNTRIKRIQSKSVTLDIKAIPDQFTGKTWLPATKVQLVEDWPEVNKNWYAGEPLTRTLALFADGLTSAQLPVMSAAIPADVKQYPDQPVLKDTPSNTGFSGVRQNKIALIPSHAGSFTFPAIKIQWWNTQTDQQETAILPAKTVTILPAKATTHNQANMPVTPATEPMPAPNQSENQTPRTEENDNTTTAALPTPEASSSSSWWPWISLLLASGWLITLFIWWKQKHMITPENKRTDARNSNKSFEKTIRHACEHNDAAQARQALLNWAASVWPEHNVVNLGAIAERVDDELKEQLQLLNQSLYAKDKNDWKGSALWQAFKQQQAVKNNTDKPSALSPLYPVSAGAE